MPGQNCYDLTAPRRKFRAPMSARNVRSTGISCRTVSKEMEDYYQEAENYRETMRQWDEMNKRANNMRAYNRDDIMDTMEAMSKSPRQEENTMASVESKSYEDYEIRSYWSSPAESDEMQKGSDHRLDNPPPITSDTTTAKKIMPEMERPKARRGRENERNKNSQKRPSRRNKFVIREPVLRQVVSSVNQRNRENEKEKNENKAEKDETDELVEKYRKANQVVQDTVPTNSQETPQQGNLKVKKPKKKRKRMKKNAVEPLPETNENTAEVSVKVFKEEEKKKKKKGIKERIITMIAFLRMKIRKI